MTEPTAPPATTLATDEDPLAGQPIERVVRDGVEYVLLGTAHVSPRSVAAVRALLERESFDAVAVELCPSRARAMRDPDQFAHMDLFQVIRQGKVGMLAASLVLAAFQERLAAQYGIRPGAEMQAAMDGADRLGVPFLLIDREVGITLRRAWRGVGFWQRLGLLGGLLASVFERNHVEEAQIEKLKQGDLLESAFSEFATGSPPLYRALIAERDAYMAARLREEAARRGSRRVLVVVGAGHLKGLCEHLRTQREDPATLLAGLAASPPASRWPKGLAVGLVLMIFLAIALAFRRDADLGLLALRDWVLCTAAGAGLGALVAGAHPLSLLVAMIAAPLKPFRPGVPAGGLSAMVEAWRRKPRVADFHALRADVTHWRGWWRNRVARVLLNFLLVSLGTIAGEYLAGIRILKSLF
ncbi:MAG: TraB/GumN family protein [Fulvimonas sp.]|nr:TraB/GumN family protein [Fulvimonas sp.]